jgi:outer membrane receptor for ferrienterochelin and colicins
VSYEEMEEVTYPGYSIWKLSLMQTFCKGISMTIGVDNLFNYIPEYYYSNSPYTTGSTVSAGVSIDINNFF